MKKTIYYVDKELLTVKDVIDTMTDAQKNTLYFYVTAALKEKIKVEPPYAAIESFNENQKKVLYYLIGVAIDESCKSDDILEIVKKEN